jgi:uncharacterized protein (TIGR02001 family)
MNKSLIALAITSLVGFSAQAAEELSVSTNFGVTSNYKYRGQDQTENKPAVQGGFDYSNSGFYLGNWNSSIAGANGIEMDFYGGYKGEASDVGYDVGVLYYYYPEKNKTDDINTTEIYAALSYSIATLKYSRTVSSQYFSATEGKGTGYFDLSANYEFSKGLTLNGHVGSTRFSGDAKNIDGAVNYTDYKVGVTYDLGSGFGLSGAVVGANKKDEYKALTGEDINKARFIVTLSKAM